MASGPLFGRSNSRIAAPTAVPAGTSKAVGMTWADSVAFTIGCVLYTLTWVAAYLAASHWDLAQTTPHPGQQLEEACLFVHILPCGDQASSSAAPQNRSPVESPAETPG